MKKIISAFLAAVIALLMPIATSARDTSLEETLAYELKSLGLFKGVSENNFDLEREPTRVEALVILIRVLGKEQDALGGEWYHPFTDVPKWADNYVGYAYENGLTYGISDTEFGSGNAGAGTFLTFVLRALGYSDTNGEDFSWKDPYTLSKEVGILPNIVNVDEFWRSDVASVSYAALGAYLKDSDETLAEKLIAAGMFTNEQFYGLYDSTVFDEFETENVTETVGKTVAEEEQYIPEAVEEATADEVSYSGKSATHSDSSMTEELAKSLEGIAVFWAPTGSKIHLDHECSSFKLGVAYAGTLDEAQSVRSGGWCGKCAKGQGEYVKNYHATVDVILDCYTYSDYLNGIPE